MEILFLIIGLVIGAVAVWFILKFKFERERGVPQAEVEALNKQINDLQADKRVFEEKVIGLADNLKSTLGELEDKREEIIDLSRQLSAKEAELKGLGEKLAEYKDEVEQLQKKFTIEFENLANRIFEEKSQKFTDQNKMNITEILKPLSEKIKDFEKRVEDTYNMESRERFSLQNEVKRLFELNKQLSDDAVNLTRALKGEAKKMGQFGEVILESILEYSGLVRDREYFIQQSFTDEDNKRLQPDVVVKLPGERNVIIDSKVSLVAYERFSSTDDKIEQDKALQEHIASMKGHILGLSQKNYQDIYQLKSLDFVIMFVPIEPAYMFAIQKDPQLWSYAYDKRILLISPTNLIAILKTITSLWQQENQNRNAMEIARQSGALYDKLVGFLEDLVDVGKKINAAQASYKDAMKKAYEGKGNIVKRAEDIKELGAKTSKQMPQIFLDRMTEEVVETDE